VPQRRKIDLEKIRASPQHRLSALPRSNTTRRSEPRGLGAPEMPEVRQGLYTGGQRRPATAHKLIARTRVRVLLSDRGVTPNVKRLSEGSASWLSRQFSHRRSMNYYSARAKLGAGNACQMQAGSFRMSNGPGQDRLG
jgi:hypothetical protein